MPCQSGCLDNVVAAEAVDDDAIVRVEVGDRHLAAQARHRDHAVVVGDRDGVVTVSRVEDDGVARTVGTAKVDVDLFDVGLGQVVDRDVVRAALGVDVDGLDVVEIHRDVGDIAGQPGVPAVGRDVDVLVDVGAVEQEGVVARLPVDRVAAVAGIPDERVVAGTEQGHIVPTPAEDKVVALAAGDLVVAVAAVDREVDLAGLEPGSVDGVVAGKPVDGERVEGALGAGERHLRRQSVDDYARAAAGDGDGVVAGRAVDDHVVRRPVTLAAARRSRQVDVDLLGVGPGEVVDRDGVGAAQRVDLDVLDAVEVHGDVGDVAEQPHPAAIGRDVHVLGDVGAVEHQRIGAGLALDDVAAVARVPDERVVAVAEQGHVVAAAADHGVVAVATDERVGALAAGDGVVAGAAIDGEADHARRHGGRVDRVVAVAGVDRQAGRRPPRRRR